MVLQFPVMASIDLLGDRLRYFRNARSLLQQQVAEQLGVRRATVSQWERGAAEPPLRRLVALAALYAIKLDDLVCVDMPSAFAEPQAVIRPMSEAGLKSLPAPKLPDHLDMQRDVPVFGSTFYNPVEGAFQLDAVPIDYVRCPPGLVSARDVYAIYVAGDSMEPKYHAGDLVFVHPGRPPRIGDAVVVQLRGPDNSIQALTGTLRKRMEQHVELQKYTPPTAVLLDKKKILIMHRILTNNELFGL